MLREHDLTVLVLEKYFVLGQPKVLSDISLNYFEGIVFAFKFEDGLFGLTFFLQFDEFIGK